jgi:hypothetical protein
MPESANDLIDHPPERCGPFPTGGILPHFF